MNLFLSINRYEDHHAKAATIWLYLYNDSDVFWFWFLF